MFLAFGFRLMFIYFETPGYIGFSKSCQIHYIFVKRLRLRIENGDGSSDSTTHTSTGGKRLLKRFAADLSGVRKLIGCREHVVEMVSGSERQAQHRC